MEAFFSLSYEKLLALYYIFDAKYFHRYAFMLLREIVDF